MWPLVKNQFDTLDLGKGGDLHGNVAVEVLEVVAVYISMVVLLNSELDVKYERISHFLNSGVSID